MLKKVVVTRKGHMSKKHGRKARVATKKGLIKRGQVPEAVLPKAERVVRKK